MSRRKHLIIGKHNIPNVPGFEAMTLLIEDGKVDKYGYHKKGKIIAQFFGVTVEEAEAYAQQFLDLYNNQNTNKE